MSGDNSRHIFQLHWRIKGTAATSITVNFLTLVIESCRREHYKSVRARDLLLFKFSIKFDDILELYEYWIIYHLLNVRWWTLIILGKQGRNTGLYESSAYIFVIALKMTTLKNKSVISYYSNRNYIKLLSESKLRTCFVYLITSR